MPVVECTLNQIEALRVAAILEEACEKLLFLENMHPSKTKESLGNHDRISKSPDEDMGREIAQILQDQRTHEQTYERLIAQRSVLKGLANKSKFKENEKDIQDISRQLRESTKALCRNLVKSSTASSPEARAISCHVSAGQHSVQQNEIQHQCHRLIEIFRQTIGEITRDERRETEDHLDGDIIRGQGAAQQQQQQQSQPQSHQSQSRMSKKMPNVARPNNVTLATTALAAFVRQKKMDQAQVQHVIQKEREVVEWVKHLGLELEQAKVDHQQDVAEHQCRYVKLKDTLLELKSRVNMDIQYARREAQAKTASTLRLYAHEMHAQAQAHTCLSRDVALEEQVHHTSLLYLRTRDSASQRQVQDWSHKLERDREELETQILTLRQLRDTQLMRLGQLRARKDAEAQVRALAQAELERLRELEHLAEAEAQRLALAAQAIQTQARKYLGERERQKVREGSKKKTGSKKKKTGSKKKKTGSKKK